MARLPARDSLADLNREITIAGGGLAGLSLAVSLRRHDLPVTLLEAGNYPRHRVCGEFISGVSQETLAVLGITAAFEGSRQHQTVEWHACGRLLHRDQLPEPAIGISRHRLDERLLQLALAAGVKVRTGTRALPESREGLVWAAGRRPCKGQWIGLKAHVQGLEMFADLAMHAGKNGYAGLAGVEDDWTNVCGLFRIDRTIRAKGEDLLPAYLEAGGNQRLAVALRNAGWREGSFSAIAGFELGRQQAIPGLVTVGDAESMIPPFTGNGMSMAFQAAERATAPLAAWSRGDCQWEVMANLIRASLTRGFRRRLLVASALHPLLLAESGRTLLQNLAACRLLPFHPMLALVR